MKRFTLVALATLIGTSSVVAFSPSVKAETPREEYCRHHDCGRDYRYERDRARYEREREHARYEQHRERYRWYDRRTGEWRYGYR